MRSPPRIRITETSPLTIDLYKKVQGQTEACTVVVTSRGASWNYTKKDKSEGQYATSVSKINKGLVIDWKKN